MKKILLFFVLFNMLFSAENNLKNLSLTELFNQKKYAYICDKRWDFIDKYNNKKEDLLSLVAYACLKKRNITPALDLAKVLKVTKEGRKNATYIVTLFLMKKLIIQMLNDDMSITNVSLPQITDNNLGKAFYYIQEGKFTKNNYKITIKTDKNVYKIRLTNHNNVLIEEYSGDKLIKREYYW